MNKLFTEFLPKSDSDWKNNVSSELKNLDFSQLLVYKTLEGIDIEPFYTIETTNNLAPLPKSKTGWDIFTNIQNHFLIEKNEVDGFIIDLKKNKPVIGFKNILKIHHPNQLMDVSFDSSNLFVDFDIYGHLISKGNWYNSKEEDENLVKSLLENPQFEKPICVNNSIFQNSGANMTQQLAFALSHANEYIETFGNEIVSKLYFHFSVGGNYFFEIAKLRAFRFLWQLFLKNKNINNEPYILTESSIRNKSILDSHNNLIRLTLEASSAIFGGSDGVFLNNYDLTNLKNSTDDFSAELSHKIQLILKKESYFDKFIDPVEGNYFIESLTNQMITNAGELFKEIEEKGGVIEGMKSGFIQKMVDESHEIEQNLFDQKTQVLIGVNKFRNEKEISEISHDDIIEKSNVLFYPVLPRRIAQKIEQNQ